MKCAEKSTPKRLTRIETKVLMTLDIETEAKIAWEKSNERKMPKPCESESEGDGQKCNFRRIMEDKATHIQSARMKVKKSWTVQVPGNPNRKDLDENRKDSGWNCSQKRAK